jgi:hypothetical protein
MPGRVCEDQTKRTTRTTAEAAAADGWDCAMLLSKNLLYLRRGKLIVASL